MRGWEIADFRTRPVGWLQNTRFYKILDLNFPKNFTSLPPIVNASSLMCAPFFEVAQKTQGQVSIS